MRRSSLMPAFFVLVPWFLTATMLGDLGVFHSRPDAPPYPLLLAVLAPPIIFAVSYARSERIRDYVHGLDLEFLTAMQAWRFIGGMFLVLMSYELVPATFAWPAGVGDLIVGFYAPFVVLALVRRRPSWRLHVMLLNILGLVDFVGAVGSGILSGNNPLGLLRGAISTDILQGLPLSIIPTFAVPAWIIVHIISLLKVSHATDAAAASDPAPAS